MKFLLHALASVCVFGSVITASAQDVEPVANTRWYKGSYDYGYLDKDTIRGHEDFTVTVHADGSRTVETFVDLRELGHQSNAIMRVDQSFRPMDAYSSFWRFGAYRGAARFWLTDDTLHSNVVGPRGEASHSVPFPVGATLRLHPVIIEGWQAATFDRTHPMEPGPQVRPLYNMVTTSETGVWGIGMFQDNVIAFQGSEIVETPAGTFEADHYTFYDGRYDIWLHGPDQILVRYVAPANGREYRLTRFEVGP